MDAVLPGPGKLLVRVRASSVKQRAGEWLPPGGRCVPDNGISGGRWIGTLGRTLAALGLSANSLEDVPEAFRYLEEGHARDKV